MKKHSLVYDKASGGRFIVERPDGDYYEVEEADARIGEIIAALRKFGIHSQGEGMERIGACKATRLAPPDFKKHGECTCGLSRYL